MGVVARERGHGAGGIAGAGTLYLGDAAAEVGYELGAVRAGHIVSEVEYLYAFERGGQVVLRYGGCCEGDYSIYWLLVG